MNRIKYIILFGVLASISYSDDIVTNGAVVTTRIGNLNYKRDYVVTDLLLDIGTNDYGNIVINKGGIEYEIIPPVNPDTNDTESVSLAGCKGGWRNPTYYSLNMIPRGVQVNKQHLVQDGDIYKLLAYDELYSETELIINSDSRESDYSVPDGTWSLDYCIPENSCILSNNYVITQGSISNAVFQVRFTESSSGKSKTLMGSISGLNNSRTNIVDSLYKDVPNTWRRSYTKYVYDHFSQVNWTNDLQYYLGCIDHEPVNSSCMRWPRCINLWEDYNQMVKYGTGKYGNIGWGLRQDKTWTYLAHTCVTNYIPETFPIEGTATKYIDSVISFARVPKKSNKSFFWPELQDALRCTSADRGEWYSELPITLISPHYALIATHTSKVNPHKFCTSLSRDTFANSSFYNGTVLKSTIGVFGDISLVRLSQNTGLPEGHPIARFLGTYGNENYSSLYHLSPSLGNKIPGIIITQHATVHPVVLTIKASRPEYDNSYGWRNVSSNQYLGNYIYRAYDPSRFNTFKYDVDLSKWTDPNQTTNQWDIMDENGRWHSADNYSDRLPGVPIPGIEYECDYSWMRKQMNYYWKDYCPKMAMDDPNNNPVRIIDFTDGDTELNFKYHNEWHLPIGQHYAAHGFDSGYPIGLYYNGYYILVGEFWYSSGGNCLLNPVIQDMIDQVMVQDSIKYFGVEEHITRVNCCDLDPEHRYHEH